ncbi:cytochrome c-type biogenesis protein CcmH [Parvularcula sp. ZS-1/3]|uniref:Cytochrome c-type biogenesis protein n=1 Tax=Parvularcula mediterranea TaxID=2732508 RepID=A0A7Y3RL04_9PROT|nr:cytochrome c-type biogenesis protein [Parvularcula mediterranea]NNU16022.1 cytochrome c-type biogenesis protein CcmH [Parvularcula mediterranea]
MILPALLFLAASLAPQEQARADAIAEDIRCLVCQNQSVAESEAELAKVMRALIEERVAAGDSDDEVRRYLTDRYGQEVLLRPAVSAGNALLWAGPIIALCAAALWAFSLFRRGAKAR